MAALIFATSNAGKIREVKSLLSTIPIQTLNDIMAICPPPVENGKTFLENARIKARQYFACTGSPVIADDSGLVVPALNGRPGVYSSRYSGENANDADNNALLLQQMQTLEAGERAAYFECVVVFKNAAFEKSFVGRCHGEIGKEPKGINGFGYDPLFFVKEYGRTLAELTFAEKNSISHRAKALIRLEAFLIKRHIEY